MYHVALVWMLIRLSHGQLTVVIGQEGGKDWEMTSSPSPAFMGNIGKTGWKAIETLMDING